MRKYFLFTTVVLATLSNCAFAASDDTGITTKLAQQAPSAQRAQNAIKEIDYLFMLPSKNANMQEVKDMRQKAQQAMQQGDYANAIKIAEAAKQRYVELARAAIPEKSRVDQQENEYKQKLTSTESLLESLRKTGRDYGRSTSDPEARAGGLIRDAKLLAMNRRFNDARDMLDKAANMMNSALSSMTRGAMQTAPKDTSPKGVYEYAKFSNETYKAMTDHVMDPKNKFPLATDPTFLDDVRQGDMIRKDALAIGNRGMYPEATQRMSESSAFYKKAARAAGMPIQDSYD